MAANPTQGDDGIPTFNAESDADPSWKSFVKKLNQLGSVVRSIVPRGGRGYTMRRNVGGTSYDITPAASSSTSVARPFKVKLRKKTGTENQWQALVGYGYILKSLKPTDFLEISGLDDGTDDNWIDVTTNDQLWLEIPIESSAATSAEVFNGDGFEQDQPPWTQYAFVEAADNDDTTSPQNVLRVIIADINPPEKPKDPPVIEQRLETNLLLLFNPCGVLARPAVVAMPSPY